MPSRRDILKAIAAAPASALLAGRGAAAQGPRITVIGAGAFGGWTALELVRSGARVTLVDAWGPGNARASSGGETRVIRTGYGSRTVYTRMAKRALELWRAHDKRYGRGFFKATGALWMFGKDDTFRIASIAAFQAERIPFQERSVADARRNWPQIDFTGISSLLFEPEAGYLLARRACEHVVECVVAEGGEYRQGAVAPPVWGAGSRLSAVTLSDGQALAADAFVFACGPWLGHLFPNVVGKNIAPTRQDVFYFGTPPGDARFQDDALPVWVDFGERLIYGIPGNANRGFKVADDTSGPPFDPTDGQRDLNATGVKTAREFLARRFPALGNAPLVGSEVCQYESSPDTNYIIDRHPAASNVWIVGGGSGHGFKMGPAIGELVASLVIGNGKPDPFFSLSRFARAGTSRHPEKWS
jgi:glycine/D-amino acid oxidase-like deaminating enzyme